MKPWWHLLFTSIISLILYFLNYDSKFIVSFFFSSLLIDIDHIFDYVIFLNNRAKNPFVFISSLKEFLFDNWGLKAKKMILFFHSYELLLLVYVIKYLTDSKIISGIFYGMLFHMFLDLISNVFLSKCKNPLVYSFCYRWFHSFKVKKLKSCDR